MLDLKGAAAAEVTAGVFAFPAVGLCGPKVLVGGQALDVRSETLSGRQSGVTPCPKTCTDSDMRRMMGSWQSNARAVGLGGERDPT
jgi:hypothetical protein